jgi:hypothetical protein
MSIRKLSAWVLCTSILFGPPLGAQTPGASKSKPTSRKTTQKLIPTDWDKQAKKYQGLLADVDISSDPDVKHAVYMKWADATCQSKRSSVHEALGGSDTSVSNAVYTACAKRLQDQESKPSTTDATGPSANPATPVRTPPSASSTPTVTLPQGCASIPQLNADFKTDTPLQFPAPSNDVWNPDPKWVQLNANSSGGEVSTKSTVWLGYINRLRYNATLSGKVSPIAAPTIPNSIFPSGTPAPASQPGQNKPPKAAPLHGAQSVFDSFTTCFQDISTTVVAFQSSLSNEELLMNNVRDRIKDQIDSLQPIVNTVGEARAAADRSMLPQNEIPAFPIGDIIQLRSLLTEFISKYAEFAQWASTDAWNTSEFQRVSTGAASTAQALDKYLVAPSSSTPNAQTSSNTDPTAANSGDNGANTHQTTTTRGTQAESSITTASAGPGEGTKKKTPKAQAKANPGQSGTSGTPSAPAGATGNNPTATRPGTGSATDSGQGSGASAGTTTSGGTSHQPTSPSAIDLGSEEVENYEANREYINKWTDGFRKVTSAPASYFVLTYKPQCGGWFGQGTSTQMQLTVADATNPSPNPPQTNLDKVVCQSALTVSNGLGLSFVPDRTPAFVPSTNSGTNGSPVLGYSSEASVRPAYSLQVNAVLWSPRESNFELHWSLGAMLTAVTGGATTDIITGPSFSFKKRAFFISPVYDLGQRTVFQSGFTVGMPQGVLTSAPTRQTWKSGFGLTISFPLSPGSSTTNSSNSGGNPGTSTPSNSTTGGTKSQKGNKPNPGSGSGAGNGG